MLNYDMIMYGLYNYEPTKTWTEINKCSCCGEQINLGKPLRYRAEMFQHKYKITVMCGDCFEQWEGDHIIQSSKIWENNNGFLEMDVVFTSGKQTHINLYDMSGRWDLPPNVSSQLNKLIKEWEQNKENN